MQFCFLKALKYQNLINAKKSDKALLIIYAGFECITKKFDGRKNFPENSATLKVSKHIPSGFSVS